jgi:hypothetical protein
MRVGVQICDRINGDGDIISVFECLARSRLDSHAGGDAREDDTSYAAAAQLQV